MGDIEIIVDNRENFVFIELIENKLQHYKISHANLDVGDIHIKYNEKLVLVIERKTINDLAASLVDSRYHEQKMRLKSTMEKCRVIYVIEGGLNDLSAYNSTFTIDTYNGCLIGTIFRDKIPVYVAADINHTIELIDGICKRLHKYEKDLQDDTDCTKAESDYCKTIKLRKKDNLTPYVIFISQLRVIPGVSAQIAEKIAEIYPSMTALIKALENDGINVIKNIKISTRCIGNVLSERIYNSIK